jgi:transcriptional regulator with XRE-family HTH domain
MPRLTGRFDGPALHRIRVDAGLSRPALAAKCAQAGHTVTPQHIARLEGGNHDPREATLKALATALHVDVHDLLVNAGVA